MEYLSKSGDLLNYLVFNNPASSVVVESMKFLGQKVGRGLPRNPPGPDPLRNMPPVNRIVLTGSPFLRLAGLSGAVAAGLGAYGSHSVHFKEGNEDRKRLYKIANNYHFIHSLALIAAPLSSYPKAAGSFTAVGIVLFCGPCYYEAFQGSSYFRKYTPIGGVCLIFGWLCLVL